MMTLLGIEADLGTQPKILHLLHDIDGATRDPGPLVFPVKTTWKMVRGKRLRPTEARVREMIELGSGRPEPQEEPWFTELTEFYTPQELWDIRRHTKRPLIEGVRESIDAIKSAGVEAGIVVEIGNLSGRNPHLHGETHTMQKADGLKDLIGFGLELNPGVGTYNWKVARTYARLTGTRDFVGKAGDVVMVEDDLQAEQAMDALNELQEVRAAGTQIITYRKRIGFWNPDWLLRRGGIDPKGTNTVIPFDDFNWMAEDCIRRIKAGLI